MRRDWSEARAKVDREGCRIAQARGLGAVRGDQHVCDGPVEAAHVIGRKYDPADGLVRPDDIVPLCRFWHGLYDAGAFDLLPYLTPEEQARAVLHVGIARAWERTTGTRR